MNREQLAAYHEEYQRTEMVQRLARTLPKAGVIEPLPGLIVARAFEAMQPVYGMSRPSFCVVAQGCKEVHLAENRYQYDPYNYLLPTAELPIVSQVLEASQEKPYLGLQLILDTPLIASVMVELAQTPPQSQKAARAIEVNPLDSDLLDATLRLVKLLDSPANEARVLLPLIKREIVYRLLSGPQGQRLRQMTVLGGQTHRISQAVDKICKQFARPLYVEEVARSVGMSVSSFHHHFKIVTALTPLQFQKQLRLQEARRLMLSEEMDAATAGYQVGYDDASHFNNDYKRLFGITPMRDVERLREATPVNGIF